MKNIIISLTFIFSIVLINAQNESPLKIKTKIGKGIEILQKDSLFAMQFQFRMQNRAGYLSKSEEDFTPEAFEFRVRRLRMRLKGWVYNPKFKYHIQLSFSRGDMDWEYTNLSNYNTSPNIVRDAVFTYEPIKGLEFSLGQTKLPGNRQRVTSSGNLQFADRSVVNNTFTIDRDMGFFVKYDLTYIRLHAAMTSGEGRNSNKSDKGLNYTGRIDILPFGKFTNDNEEQEGDLEREQTPKLAIGATYNYNTNAIRQGGTLGNDLYNAIDMQNLHIDLLFKYKGFAFLQEYCNRIADNPVSVDATLTKQRTTYVGYGSLSQLSYCFKNNFEIAARYAFVHPYKTIYDNATYTNINNKRIEEIALGVTKYFYGHRLKVQGNLLYLRTEDFKAVSLKQQFGAILQVELGI